MHRGVRRSYRQLNRGMGLGNDAPGLTRKAPSKDGAKAKSIVIKVH